MFIKEYFIIFNLIVILKLVFAKNDYSYKYQNSWKKNYSNCGMHHQSPIELITSANRIRKLDSNIRFYNYRKGLQLPVKIENNGHTIQVTPGRSYNLPPFITAKFLSGNRYELQSFHFHWGSKNDRGSEHTVNGHHYALEMHIVHKNSKYKTLKEAMSHSDGIVVIGVLYKASKLFNDYNFGLGYVTWHLRHVKRYGLKYKINKRLFSMMNIMGNLNRNHFFAYQGSLTTPPCSESVTWIIYQDVQKISEYQLKKFRKMKDVAGYEMSDNYRRIKPLADRHVYYYSNLIL